jgi:hypothetical protein
MCETLDSIPNITNKDKYKNMSMLHSFLLKDKKFLKDICIDTEGNRRINQKLMELVTYTKRENQYIVGITEAFLVM